MSLVLRPELPASLAPRVTQAAAVGVANALRTYGIDARVKWPNDVLVGCRKKICGILAEGSLRSGSVDFVVLGVGLNANLDPEAVSGFTDGEATTVRAELGHDADLSELLASIVSHLEAPLGRLRHGFGAILAERRALECILGEPVRVRRDGQALEGRVLGLSTEGALILETETEGRVELFEGEVERLRRV
jgi:BirA family biotin operon repressor/biotin-[acetyl-CoA-carboxylase] ligase